MTPKLRIALEVLAVLVVIGLTAAYISGRESQVKMQAILDAQKTVIAQAQDDRAAHEKADAARDAQTAAQLADMAKLVAQVKTPTQIVGWSQAQLESAIRGIQITVPAPTAANPHPEAQAIIPESSLPGLRDTIAACQECTVKLSTAQADLTSRQQQMADADKQIQALKTERDAAVKAVKGTWITRFTRAAKWAIIGGAVGYAVAKR